VEGQRLATSPRSLLVDRSTGRSISPCILAPPCALSAARGFEEFELKSIRSLSVAAVAVVLSSCVASGELPTKSVDGVFSGDLEAAEAVAIDLALDAAEQHPALAGVAEIDVRQVELDWLGMAHVRLDQMADGVPVFGGQAIVHLHPSGEVASVTDGLVKDVVADTAPVLDASASKAAVEGWKGLDTDRALADLQILRIDGFDHLTWRVQVDATGSAVPSRPVVFVDAHTGDVVWEYDNLQTAKNRLTYNGRNRSRLPGNLARSEGQGVIGDQPIDDAHDHAGITYDFYFVEEGRDSYDGSGATMVSTAHHQRNYDNAFWNGSQMVYGDGDVYFYPLSQSLDVVAHELTHAVTEYSANLIYSGESGGLNEATSDILGVTVDSWSRGWTVDAATWLVGEDIAKPALGTALRYMDNPPADGVSIDHYSDYYAGIDVHYSSGIANKYFYLTVQDPALSISESANIWYRALTVYMTPSTTFAEARSATENAAIDLFGAGSAQLAAVGTAWDAVGVGAAVPWEVLATESNLSGANGSQTNFSYATPTGATAMKFELAGGTGDADLYVRFGAPPTTSTYDCRPYLNGNNEACTFSPSSNGTYYVLINGYQAYSGADLIVSHQGGVTTPAEDCTDGLDNDADGAIDCDDSDCATDLACAEPEDCTDGIDNDLDGAVDCADADCALDLACAEPEVCDDGIDNDLDGATDCADSDCVTDAACIPDEVCDDGVDNDLDGAVDCDDADCALDLACAEPEVCDDGVDNDLDGAVDCDDADCGTDLACAEPEDCADGIDNDLDGAIDCADGDCAADAACQISCPGGEFTGTLSNSNKNDDILGASGAGLYEATLTGAGGTNFDLYLEYWAGNRWRSRTSSQNSDSNEFISYLESQNVDHRWRIRRRSGNGDYTLCVQ
jgi:Zn-dependent metalloprotease